MKSPSFERLNVSFHTRENLVGGGPFTSFSFTAHRKTIPRSDVRINKHEERSLRGKERKHPGEVTSLSFGRLTDSPTVNPYSAGSSSTGGCRASRPNGSSVAMEWPFTWEIGCAGARRRKKKKKTRRQFYFLLLALALEFSFSPLVARESTTQQHATHVIRASRDA